MPIQTESTNMFPQEPYAIFARDTSTEIWPDHVQIVALSRLVA